jgi:acyl-CoA thioesterase FadM
VLIEAEVTVVTVKGGRPQRLPEAIRAAIAAHAQEISAS